MSRSVRFHEVGGPEVLRLEQVPDPTLGASEVLIRVRALGLNRAESMFRSGQYGVDPVFPSGIGYEAAGCVEAVGTGVSGLAVGAAVSVIPSFPMTEYGMHGELVLAPAHAVSEAHRHLEAGGQVGKIVVTVDGPADGSASKTGRLS